MFHALYRTILLTALTTWSLQLGASTKGSLAAFDVLKGTLHVTTSPVTQELIQAAAHEISSAHPHVTITIAENTSHIAIQEVANELADIAVTARPLSLEETQQLNVVSYRFALQGVSVIVNPQTSIQALTSQQLRDIFAGRIRSWHALGGSDSAIHTYVLDKKYEVEGAFAGLLNVALRSNVNDTLKTVDSETAMRQAIAHDRGGIGTLNIGSKDPTATLVAIDGINPSIENALSGRYPLVRYLYIHTEPHPNALVLAFVDYLASEEAKPLLQKYGFVSAPNLVR